MSRFYCPVLLTCNTCMRMLRATERKSIQIIRKLRCLCMLSGNWCGCLNGTHDRSSKSTILCIFIEDMFHTKHESLNVYFSTWCIHGGTIMWFVRITVIKGNMIWIYHESILTHRGVNRRHFQMHLLQWKELSFVYWLKTVHGDWINNKSAFVQVRAWRRIGTKPLSSAMLA